MSCLENQSATTNANEKNSYGLRLTISDVHHLIELHKIELPKIPTQLQESFDASVRDNYELELHGIVETIVMHFLNIKSMTDNEDLNSLAISCLLNLLDAENLESLFKITLDQQKALLQKAVKIAYMESQNFIDALTQLYNKRAFIHFFRKKLEWLRNSAQNWEQEPANEQILMLIMIDLDNFKQINDTHGHQRGDKVLSAFSLSISEQIKNTDLAFRWGGDEFALLLQLDSQKLLEQYDTLATGLGEFINQLHQRLSGKGLTVNGHQITINCTLGATRVLPTDTIPQNGYESTNSALLRADKALYLAKGLGKDQSKLMLRPT